jgi:threonine/homoserine/homoserine lactone efflux protein
VMALVLFLIQVFIISISGAMQPGPVTATAITMGTRNRWAGSLLAVGHAIVEFSLMLLIIFGLGSIFQETIAQIIIGVTGGLVLVYMAYGMFKTASHPLDTRAGARKDKPILAGMFFTVSNPFFLVWWATIGLGLIQYATANFGIHAFALFAAVHWLVDFLWVTALSFASFHGTTLLGPKVYHRVMQVCAGAMLFFGLFFLYKAGVKIFA